MGSGFSARDLASRIDVSLVGLAPCQCSPRAASHSDGGVCFESLFLLIFGLYAPDMCVLTDSRSEAPTGYIPIPCTR